MKIKKEIVIEIEQVRVVCQRTKRYSGWCNGCAAESEFVTPVTAALMLNQSLDQIAEFVLTGVIHGEVTPAKTFLVCLDSLLRIGKIVTDVNRNQQIKP